MNDWLFGFLIILFVTLNFMVGGSISTAALIVASAALSQYDANISLKKQLENFRSYLKHRYGE